MPDTFTVGTTTVLFTTLQEGTSRRAEAQISIDHIPGSDRSVIDSGGALPWIATLHIYLETSSAYITLEGLRGKRGWLTFIDGTAEAILTRCERTRRYPTGATEATVEFIVAG